MEKYDYFRAMREDMLQEIEVNDCYQRQFDACRGWEEPWDEYEDRLYEEFFVNDSVTGNASGSYFCNAWAAEEAICHNIELLDEALEIFGWDNSIRHSAEWCDVMIRCCIMPQVLHEIIKEMQDEEDVPF